MLVWCDLETTGLYPDKHTILEIAVIVTDDQLREQGRASWVTNEAQNVALHELDPVVQKMHTDSGLWMRSLAEGLDLKTVEHQIEAFLEARGALSLLAFDPNGAMIRDADGKVVRTPGAQLAGSTVSFDRMFLWSKMRRLEGRLHYRNLDVSTLNEVARRWWPKVHADRPKDPPNKHQAMPDIEQSIAVLRHYLAAVAPSDGSWVKTDPGGVALAMPAAPTVFNISTQGPHEILQCGGLTTVTPVDVAELRRENDALRALVQASAADARCAGAAGAAPSTRMLRPSSSDGGAEASAAAGASAERGAAAAAAGAIIEKRGAATATGATTRTPAASYDDVCTTSASRLTEASRPRPSHAYAQVLPPTPRRSRMKPPAAIPGRWCASRTLRA
jgi:oligoribonuclease